MLVITSEGASMQQRNQVYRKIYTFEYGFAQHTAHIETAADNRMRVHSIYITNETTKVSQSFIEWRSMLLKSIRGYAAQDDQARVMLTAEKLRDVWFNVCSMLVDYNKNGVDITYAFSMDIIRKNDAAYIVSSFIEQTITEYIEAGIALAAGSMQMQQQKQRTGFRRKRTGGL